MPRPVSILNGPNLNLLGEREPHLYGRVTLEEIEARCRRLAGELGMDLFFGQSNWEGQIVDWLQEARRRRAAVIVNPAGLSFHSVPVLDAVKTIEQPVIEVHITNIHRREPPHRHSIVSLGARGVICGLGPHGYEAALRAVAAFDAEST